MTKQNNELKRVGETAELELGKDFRLKIPTPHILIIYMILLLPFFVLFLTSFPNYMRGVYGNQSIPGSLVDVAAFCPVGIIVMLFLPLVFFFTKR